MKKLYIILILFWAMTSVVHSNDRKVLVEIFTNSHCPLCPPAHSAIDSYLQTNNGTKIEFIYYHMVFPYSTDKLYQDNTIDAAAKNNLYGPYSSTPQAFFNGTHVANSFNNWASNLDNLVSEQSSFDILLSGNFTDADFTINAEITKTVEVSENDLTINFVVVENVDYLGNNGIANHKNVMRKIANVNGESINIGLNETKNISSTFEVNNLWNTNELKIIAYLQSSSTKQIYQTESINYSDLSLTNIENANLPNKFQLFQNYPNPFNPTTTIEYSIPQYSVLNENFRSIQLTVYDVLGREVKTLVNKIQKPGNYEILFNAKEFPSGIYFTQLKYGTTIQTIKMVLLK